MCKGRKEPIEKEIKMVLVGCLNGKGALKWQRFSCSAKG